MTNREAIAGPNAVTGSGAGNEGATPFAGRHHARYIEPDVPVHVVSRIFQGRHLLTPGRVLNAIIVGIVARGLELYDSIELYAFAFLSNHAHFMLAGLPEHVSGFTGFVKREISRRWGSKEHINWPGTMWEESLITALPTAASQEQCLAYILGQGVKENLVARAQDWPGVHSARPLMTGTPLHGHWLCATAYGRAKRAEERKLPKNRRVVRREDYEIERQVSLQPIPAWRGLSAAEQRERVAVMVDQIEKDAQAARHGTGKGVMGIECVKATPRSVRTSLPPPPWFEERRRMVCWSNPRAPETRAYLRRYWAFQEAFRAASDRLRQGQVDVTFPPGAFRPLTFMSTRRQL